MQIIIIDYGMGNLGSVRRALEDQGATPTISDDPKQIRSADALILPGVGSFRVGMSNLNQLGISDAIRDAVANDCPLLGICLGMQLLANEGEEGGGSEGLGLIPGAVTQMRPTSPTIRIPHVGWNEVVMHQACPFFEGVADRSDFYFVHSFEFRPIHATDVLATTPHGTDFVSVVQRGNIIGTQFHPEKSSFVGCQLLSNFLKLAQIPC